MPYNESRRIINIEVFFPFFNEEEKSCLTNEGINISELPGFSPPLFNYAQFIHILDVGAIEKATKTWLMKLKQQSCEKSSDSVSKTMDKSDKSVVKFEDFDDEVSKKTSVVVDSLCKMFMRSALNLKYLILSPFADDRDVPKSNVFVGNEPGLVNLRKLKLR